jgi:hypothetical protein
MRLLEFPAEPSLLGPTGTAHGRSFGAKVQASELFCSFIQSAVA